MWLCEYGRVCVRMCDLWSVCVSTGVSMRGRPGLSGLSGHSCGVCGAGNAGKRGNGARGCVDTRGLLRPGVGCPAQATVMSPPTHGRWTLRSAASASASHRGAHPAPPCSHTHLQPKAQGSQAALLCTPAPQPRGPGSPEGPKPGAAPSPHASRTSGGPRCCLSKPLS